MTSHSKTIKIAVIGDVHDQWGIEDEVALKHLQVDLALFVGDFGNESVDVVRQIAALDLPKAVIMGNHDAWFTATEWGRKKCPYDRTKEDWVQQQLDLLGESHVGFGKLDFPAFHLSVVGSRPFSWGGPDWKFADICRERYGVNDLDASAARIFAAVKQAEYETVIFVGHNGPSGLGDRPEDPCGKDWHPIGGDFGDPDFAEAISQSLTFGKVVPLVTFGHMHHTLRHTKKQIRKRVFRSPEGVIYLNAASVPRVIERGNHQLRNFSVVTLAQTKVIKVVNVWIDQHLAIDEEILYAEPASLVSSG